MANFLLIVVAAYIGARLADRFPKQTWRGYKQDFQDWKAWRKDREHADQEVSG